MAIGCKIESEVTLANDTIAQLRHRVAALEQQLTSPQLPDTKRKLVESDLTEIKKLLERNEELLKTLHKPNSKGFVVAACCMFATFLLYGIYMMVWGLPKN